MKLAAGVTALLAVGAGLGTYFALRGPSLPAVPKAQQSMTLEQAKAEGVISGYRVEGTERWRRDYEVAGGLIHFTSFGTGCGGGFNAGPACFANKGPLLAIEYENAAAAQAQSLLRIARSRMPYAHIKFLEVTIPGD